MASDTAAKLTLDKSSAGYLVAKITFVNLDGTDPHYDDPAYALRGLELRAQADYDKRGFYGTEVRWHSGYNGVDLTEAQTAVKALDKASKGLEKLAVKFGTTYDFAEIALRFANVFGAEYWREHDYDNPHLAGRNWLRADLNEYLGDFNRQF